MKPESEESDSLNDVSYAELVAACVGARATERDRSWPTTHTLFCDETGNSGGRFYDPEQPIYAEGGWLVPNAAKQRLADTFSEIEKQHGYTAKTKGTRIKDSASGRACMVAVAEMLGHEAIPFFYLVEKRYFICAKAVETYFDPKYNLSVDPMETFDPSIRKLRADLLYRASDTVIAAFADAFRREDATEIAKTGEAWANSMADVRENGLAMQIRVSLPTIQGHMAREFAKVRATGLPKGYATLNAPSLAQTFQLIERSSPPCDLVHDHCDSLAGIYRYFFDRYRNAQHDLLPKLDGSAEIFGFRRLNSLVFGDSETTPLLRACDYLLAACADFAKRTVSGDEIPADLRAVASYGLERMMTMAAGQDPEPHAERQIGELMASDAWIDRVAQAYFHHE